MKRLESCFLLSALVAALFFSSCDNEEELILSVPKGTNTSISIDCNNLFMKLPIEANGMWEATVVGDDAYWIALINDKGRGNDEVEISIDYNETGTNRSAIVRFSDGVQAVDYLISQGTYNDSDEGANGSADTLYHYTGIGRGLSVKASATGGKDYSSLLKAQIFNYAAMKDDAVQNLPNFVTETTANNSVVSFSDFNTLQTQEKNITANLSVDVSYGLFKLGLSGHFQMYGSEKDSTKTYAATASIPRTTLTMNYEDLAIDYGWSEAMSKDYKLKRSKLFSATFINIHDSIEKLVASGQDATSKEMQTQLKNLDSKFGPVFTRVVKKGGSVDIDFQLKDMESVDTLKIGGKLTASFNSLFSLKAEAAANYLNTSHSFTSGSKLTIAVNGGELKTLNDLIAALRSITSDKGLDAKMMMDAIVAWSDSVTVGNGVIINITVAGIWDLFSDDAADEVKAYFKEKYPNNGKDGSCPYLYNIQALVDE